MTPGRHVKDWHENDDGDLEQSENFMAPVTEAGIGTDTKKE